MTFVGTKRIMLPQKTIKTKNHISRKIIKKHHIRNFRPNYSPEYNTEHNLARP